MQATTSPRQQPAGTRVVRDPSGTHLYAFFLGTYLALWLGFLYGMNALGRSWPREVPGLDLLVLSLACFRLTEIVTEEKVARCLRAPFCERVLVPRPDGTEAEEEVPAGQGLRRVAGELMLCPWCAGIWIATLATFFYALFPEIARVCLLAFAVAAGGLLFQVLVKLLDRTRKAIPEE